MCQKWFAKFHAGDCSLDDAPRLDRPVAVDRDQTETLIENNQLIETLIENTTQEIANILKIVKSIKVLVKMKNLSFILWKN